MIIEMQGDAPDEFRFVPLVDLEAGTTIRFTDNGWLGTALRSGEGTVLYTAPTGGVTKGTNIKYSVGGTTDFATDGNDLNIASGGDQILAYQGETASPTFIFAASGSSTIWHTDTDDSNQTDLPSGLTNGVNAITIGSSDGAESEFDNIYYSGTTIGTKDVILAAVANAGNWVGSNTLESPITTDFTINEPTTDPALTITSPSDNQVFPASTANIPINFNISNFTLAGEIGDTETTDGTGDGYIIGRLTENGVEDGSKNIFSNTVDFDNPEAGFTYIIIAELVDNNGASLSPKVEATITFSIELPCDLVLGDIETTCDALTGGVDTYNGSITFTGGNTGATYTITAPSGVAITGDHPDTIEAGIITFSGMTENVDAAITIVGGAGSSCDLSKTLNSPVCVSFPVIEHFDYTDASTLGSQSAWKMLNSGDEMLIASGNLDYTGLEASTGNKITFDETGSETYTAFSDVTSGTVYASFLLKVTGFQTGSNIDVTDGGYIAALAGSTSGYDARFWVRPNPDTSGTTFDIGFGVESSNPTFTTGTYALNDVLFIVMAYNMDDATVSTWVNPEASSFEGTIPTATISGTDTGAPAAINLFVLRQDSSNETPFIELDALRISNSWADVTPNDGTASVANNSIEGFATYPNPVTNNRFTISSSSNGKKEIVIFNVLGKKVLTSSFLGTKSNVDVSAISSGIYILKVTEDGKTATKKLVIK